MSIDHSQTYKRAGLKNLPHKKRLEKIVDIIQRQKKTNVEYLDLGCSNGYITNILSSALGLNHAVGMDHSKENIAKARKLYPSLQFDFIDLNQKPNEPEKKYNLITCFETLEHVGNLENAVKNILSYAHMEDAFVLLSVPIEVGFWGVSKYVLKKMYGYTLEELPGPISDWVYFKKLVTNQNIGEFRDERPGWGTHFGFDYRNLDAVLHKLNVDFVSTNYFTTRFYAINGEF